MKSALQFLLLAIFLSSCLSLSSGYISGSAPPVENNFKYVGNAIGKSEVTYFLGIGGNMKEGLIREAKNNLIANYPVENGQILVNFTIDHKRTMIFGFLLWTHRVIVTADILEYQE